MHTYTRTHVHIGTRTHKHMLVDAHHTNVHCVDYTHTHHTHWPTHTHTCTVTNTHRHTHACLAYLPYVPRTETGVVPLNKIQWCSLASLAWGLLVFWVESLYSYRFTMYSPVAFLAKIWQTMGSPAVIAEAPQTCQRLGPQAIVFGGR